MIKLYGPYFFNSQVGAERSYHVYALDILDELHAKVRHYALLKIHSRVEFLKNGRVLKICILLYSDDIGDATNRVLMETSKSSRRS